MVKDGLQSFKNKHIVFLQGPVGSFFYRFSDDLKNIGATVYQINFNGGDWFFSSSGAINFTGTLEEWSQFFINFVAEYKIDFVILFGDCRTYHRIAHMICEIKRIDIGVFEEGYVRPDYITFEEFGVNGHSQLSRDPEFYRSLNSSEFAISKTIPVGNTFWYVAWQVTLYYFYSTLLYPIFRQYQHHRPLNLFEGMYWIRSLWRKYWCKIKEAKIQDDTVSILSKKYFLVPLQISTDSQVMEHSDFESVEEFILQVLNSFALYAPKDTWLLVKHHPLDRGYHDYASLIKRIAQHHNVVSRVKYIHDQHLPTLLKHARGVVVINSTVGLSAIHHDIPLKVCGIAIYDFEGLTYQGSLEQFWDESEKFESDRNLYNRFRGYIVKHKQINGNFYRPLKKSKLKSGIIW
ncbi:MAG: capsular biosynthesis protein [Phycisphaerae bacterium]|nr:capsular biosynthesis protein [Phycisphaerae bacterium]